MGVENQQSKLVDGASLSDRQATRYSEYYLGASLIDSLTKGSACQA